MDKDTLGIVLATLAATVIATVVWVFSWAYARGAVVEDCEKLGTFYVGEKVFECKIGEKSDG